MAKKFKFYSAQELNELKRILTLPKGRGRKESIKKLSIQSGRSLQTLYNKLYLLKENPKKVVKTRKVKDASLITAPNSKRGEFVIPVKNWKLQHENGNLNIVINF